MLDTKMVDEFLGSRCLYPELEEVLKRHTKPLNNIVYRGMPCPYPIIKVGSLIRQWNGATHWSLDKNIAESFTTDYINEEYAEEMEAEFGIPSNKLFVRLIMVLDKCDKVVELYHYSKDFVHEKEVTILGYDFEITDIIDKTDDMITVKVKAVERTEDDFVF